jgi:hypothetical protein
MPGAGAFREQLLVRALNVLALERMWSISSPFR